MLKKIQLHKTISLTSKHFNPLHKVRILKRNENWIFLVYQDIGKKIENNER